MSEPSETETTTTTPADVPRERGISPVSGRLGGPRAGRMLALVALVGGCGLFVAASWRSQHSHAEPVANQPARQVVPFEPLAAGAPTLAHPGADAPRLGVTATTAQTVPPVAGQDPAAQPSTSPTSPRPTLDAIRAAPLLADPGGREFPRETAAPIVPAIVANSSPSELDQLRRGSSPGLARAARLPDRNFLIIAGAQIPCLLQTAMDTATPGYVSCLTPRDVLSDNGAVVLLEKGTRVLGEYRGGLRQGQQRLFVVWTRAVTPKGVAIRLDSPASDALGRAGFDGDIDSHFWERFGGALLLSIVDDATAAVSTSRTGETTVHAPSDAAAVALQSSVNIASSLRKPQGSEVAIFAAQDFDFSGVYGLRAR